MGWLIVNSFQEAKPSAVLFCIILTHGLKWRASNVNMYSILGLHLIIGVSDELQIERQDPNCDKEWLDNITVILQPAF